MRKLVLSEMVLAWPHLCHAATQMANCSLRFSEKVAENLKILGYTTVSYDECKILGSNMVPVESIGGIS